MNMNVMFLILIFVVFYFFIIRPQMKEKKSFEKMLGALKKGDKVITNSGIYGEVTAIKDETRITLKVAENVRIDFTKSSVSRVLNQEKEKS
ncbi:preprotein translocase subunit YajC [Fibrobacterota bacterium]